MRFMVLVPGSPESEAGEMPSTEILGAMTKYNEELVKSGVMLAGEGLHPTSKGAKVRFNGSERTVVDGPFTEAKELVAGYWVWECASRAEALEWLKRAPFDGGVEIGVGRGLDIAGMAVLPVPGQQAVGVAQMRRRPGPDPLEADAVARRDRREHSRQSAKAHAHITLNVILAVAPG